MFKKCYSWTFRNSSDYQWQTKPFKFGFLLLILINLFEFYLPPVQNSQIGSNVPYSSLMRAIASLSLVARFADRLRSALAMEFLRFGGTYLVLTLPLVYLHVQYRNFELKGPVKYKSTLIFMENIFMYYLGKIPLLLLSCHSKLWTNYVQDNDLSL